MGDGSANNAEPTKAKMIRSETLTILKQDRDARGYVHKFLALRHDRLRAW